MAVLDHLFNGLLPDNLTVEGGAEPWRGAGGARRLLEIHFATNDGLGFSTRTAQRIVKQVANRAMITKPVTPHVLRHSFAVNCVKQGVISASLKKILGHDRLETTEIYLNICPEDALAEFFQKVDGARRKRWD